MGPLLGFHVSFQECGSSSPSGFELIWKSPEVAGPKVEKWKHRVSKHKELAELYLEAHGT